VQRAARSTALRRLAQLGFAGYGLLHLLVAWLALERATGLDGALRAVAAEPYGQWVLTVVAAGLAFSTVYCLARARHPVG
jgi:hypothetical protein